MSVSTIGIESAAFARQIRHDRSRLRGRIAVLLVMSSAVILPVWTGFLLWGFARLIGLL